MDFSRSVGLRIREARWRSRQTQTQVADKLCVSTGTICHWEKGIVGIDLESAKELAEVLGTSVAYLLGEEEWGGEA